MRTSLLNAAFQEELRSRVRGDVLFDEPLSKHTSWRVGGPADALISPADEADLAEVMRFAKSRGLPLCVLGAGSNLLVRDGGIRGLTLSLGKGLRSLRVADDMLTVIADAGCRIGRLLTFCAVRGLAGLEFLADIPGTVGGVVVMNAGAMGGELKDVAAAIEVLLEDGTPQTLIVEEIPFVYRAAALPPGCVVTRAGLHVTSGDPALIQERISAIRRKRRAAQPTGASAGSTFKNPPLDYAGRLIEAAGLKRLRVGGAEVSERHANFILNTGGATAADVLALIDRIREEVWAKFNVLLELEVKVVGEP
jgi:UDP-N-acetylmuramate dehydrogenase